MKISAELVDGEAILVFSNVFSGIGIRTDVGLFGIAQRDGGIEVQLNGKLVWSSEHPVDAPVDAPGDCAGVLMADFMADAKSAWPEVFLREEVEIPGGYHNFYLNTGPERGWSTPYKKSGIAEYKDRVVRVAPIFPLDERLARMPSKRTT